MQLQGWVKKRAQNMLSKNNHSLFSPTSGIASQDEPACAILKPTAACWAKSQNDLTQPIKALTTRKKISKHT